MNRRLATFLVTAAVTTTLGTAAFGVVALAQTETDDPGISDADTPATDAPTDAGPIARALTLLVDEEHLTPDQAELVRTRLNPVIRQIVQAHAHEAANDARNAVLDQLGEGIERLRASSNESDSLVNPRIVLRFLGLSQPEFTELLGQGNSIADIVEIVDKDLDGLVAVLMEPILDRLRAAVATGDLEPGPARARAQHTRQAITERLG
jgi:hypothetical protein